MSLQCTGTELGETNASTLRQRHCLRAVCAIPRPQGQENCCDGEYCHLEYTIKRLTFALDGCLVEVARRECYKEGSHNDFGVGKTLARHSDADNSKASNSNEPCAEHYKQAKDNYGSFLNDLGCICKILLSLNIESCCVLPSHSPARPARHGFSRHSTKDKGVSTSCNATKAADKQVPVDCSKGSCCVTPESSGIVANLAPGNSSSNDCSTQDCCTSGASQDIKSDLLSSTLPYFYNNSRFDKIEKATSMAVDRGPSEMICPKDGCCDEAVSQSSKTGNFTKNSDSCAVKGCCSGVSDTAPGANGIERKRHPRKGVNDKLGDSVTNDTKPGKEDNLHGFVQLFSKTAHISKSNRCDTKNGTCHSDSDERSAKSDNLQIFKQGLNSIAVEDTQNVDLERAFGESEHFVVGVQGMDCTGCEKKLYRSLTALREVSNVKTSLMNAQAEFDLSPSKSIHGNNILHTMEKMTGFTCTRIVHLGAELELIVQGNLGDFLENWPFGVINISVLCKNKIQVSYQPRLVGARDLLLDPFFQATKLAPRSDPPSIAAGRAHLLHTLWMTILSALLTIPVLVLSWAPLPKHEILYGAISLALATIVQFVVAGPFYVRTVTALIFSRMIDMDLLIVLSSTTAYIYSLVAYGYVVAGKPLATGEFFETSTLLITLIMVGRTVSSFARHKAIESIGIESLQTPTAILVDETTQAETEIDTRLIQYGDMFKVLPDMSIVTDGVIASGESEVDESMITGEADLIPKKPGFSVVAGSVNHSGSLVIKVTRLPSENTIKEIGDMVDEAKTTKPKIQEIADRVAGYFVPLILGLALLVFIIWVAIGMKVRHESAAVSLITAMTFAISVLTVSCPCAIGLAVPMVVAIAGGAAARHGLIFKTAETIEIGRNISHVVFDKTGTLMQGKLYVVAEDYPSGTQNKLTSAIWGLTTNSKHPVSKAVATYLSNSGTFELSTVNNATSIAGSGIEAMWNSSIVRGGNPYWLKVEDHPSVRKTVAQGLTTFCVTLDHELVAVFGLQDLLRNDALETINELKHRSIDISIISGDNEAAVQSVASQLSIPLSNIRSRCSPKQKQAYIKSLQSANDHDHDCDGEHSKLHNHHHKHSDVLNPTYPKNTILFIGDGTNDAPSLAQASIGLHISEGGTDVAQSAADAVLLRPHLKSILTLIHLSKAFHRRVVFNFVWSGVYNLAAVLLAAGAFTGVRGGNGVRIPPEYAGLGEVVSVVPVVAVAVGLRWWEN